MTDEFLFGYERAGSPSLMARLAAVQDKYGPFIVVCRQDRQAGTPRVGEPGPFEEGRIWTPFVTLAVPAEDRKPDLAKLIKAWAQSTGNGWSADPIIPSELRSIEDPVALGSALEAYLSAIDTVRTRGYLVPDKTAFLLTSWAIESLAVPVTAPNLVADLPGGRSYRVVVSCEKGNLGDVSICAVG